ncbi:MAG: amidohydrolase family protein [Burkholderiaceae bacterium]|jgi:cytosine/adenosine deaminase-related metal-dependent hydrolase|nr:amidohydrolase family protein [Burkholderiaceae bacterium]
MTTDYGGQRSDGGKQQSTEISLRHPSSVIHRAGWIIIDPWTIYPNGYVRVEDGIIREIGQGTNVGGDKVRDYGDGVIFPALVNAHTHLELCALKGRIATHKGFGFWVRDLIEKRALLDHKVLLDASEIGIRDILASGCCAVAEISSLGLTLEPVQKSGLAGVWFRECLGDRICRGESCIRPFVEIPHDQTSTTESRESEPGDMRISMAGHAPHTTSPEVLMEIKNRTRRQSESFSIHLAESDEEMAFLTTAEGPWKDFLLSRGIDTKSWGLPVQSPVIHLQSIDILDNRTILVHLLHADQTDMNIIHESGAHVCLCPRSNTVLHRRLPDLDRMLKTGVNLCLGTDSLASVSSLSILDEMAFVSKSFPMAAPERIFQMATLGGASALGLDNRMGTLVPGKQARLSYIDIQASKAFQVVEALVNFNDQMKHSVETSCTMNSQPNPRTVLQ